MTSPVPSVAADAWSGPAVDDPAATPERRPRNRHARGEGADVRTVELGQFTDDHAEAIAAKLVAADIVWWHKDHGRLTRLVFAGDWGVRLFVDRARLDEARALATEVTDG